MVSFSSDRIWLLPLFLLFYAPGYGGTIVTRPAMQGDYFGRKAFGTIQGLAMGVSGLAAMAGPVIAGRIYDVTDSYRLAFLIFSVMSATGCLIVLLFAKRPRAPEVAPAPAIVREEALREEA
ncbi:MAG: MFS transporter [Chloroflexi bacterium]|nr:MFS transporter [Chloroflexota bacterium]